MHCMGSKCIIHMTFQTIVTANNWLITKITGAARVKVFKTPPLLPIE